MENEIKEITLKVSEKTDLGEAAGPDKVAQIARDYLENKSDGKEHFCCLHLNAKKKVTHVDHVSMGNLTTSLVHPREVFRPAIANGASAVVFFHNHPSGDPSPSQEDIDITERLEEAAELLEITALDHVILGEDSHTSLREQGLM